MTFKEFAHLVLSMREAQKHRASSPNTLRVKKAAAIEARVDALLSKLSKPEQEQANLFEI